LDISKINKQGCGLARKGHGNAINGEVFGVHNMERARFHVPFD